MLLPPSPRSVCAFPSEYLASVLTDKFPSVLLKASRLKSDCKLLFPMRKMPDENSPIDHVRDLESLCV